VITLVRVKIDLLSPRVDLVVDNDLPDDLSHICLIGQLLEKRPDPLKLSVAGIIVPGDDGHGVLWLKHIRDWRVVNYDDVSHLAPQPAHILHIGIAQPSAMFPEELVGANPFRIDYVDKGISILGEACCEDHNFVVAVHAFQELAHSGPH